jgi:hypothetical protein
MAEQPTKSTSWRCRHAYPVLVVIGPKGERRARCLGCGELGPSRTSSATALRALRESFARPEET